MVIAIEARLLPPREQTIITQAMADENSALLAAYKIRTSGRLPAQWLMAPGGRIGT